MKNMKEVVFGVVTLALIGAVSFNYVSIKKLDKTEVKVTGSVAAPSGEDFKNYIMSNPEVIVSSLEGLQKRMAEERNASVEKNVANNMDKIYTDNSFVIGNPDAEIKMVEFFDYRCSHCKSVSSTLNDLVKENPNVKIYMKDMPILGQDSLEAAKAAVAAGFLGKYSEFHDALFAYNGKLDTKAFREIATKVGLNPDELIEMTNSDKVSQILMENRMAASIVELQGTPTIFIEDKMYSGMPSKEGFEEAIRSAMEAKLAE